MADTLELLLSVISIIAAIIASSATLGYRIGGRFMKIEARLDSMESRLGSLELRISSIESEVRSLGSRVDSLESELKSLGSRVDSLESEVKSLGSRVSSLESEVKSVGSLIERIARGFSSYQEFFVEFLVGENIITREKGDLARN